MLPASSAKYVAADAVLGSSAAGPLARRNGTGAKATHARYPVTRGGLSTATVNSATTIGPVTKCEKGSRSSSPTASATGCHRRRNSAVQASAPVSSSRNSAVSEVPGSITTESAVSTRKHPANRNAPVSTTRSRVPRRVRGAAPCSSRCRRVRRIRRAERRTGSLPRCSSRPAAGSRAPRPVPNSSMR